MSDAPDDRRAQDAEAGAGVDSTAAVISVPCSVSASPASRCSLPTCTKAPAFLPPHEPRERSTRITAAVIGTVSAATHATITTVTFTRPGRAPPVCSRASFSCSAAVRLARSPPREGAARAMATTMTRRRRGGCCMKRGGDIKLRDC